MPNPAFSYTAVASPLLGAEELEQLSRKFQPRLEQAGGRSGEPSADQPRLHLVLTGGTEQKVLDKLVDPELVLLLAHRSHNSLPACLEILARVRSDGGRGEILLLDEGPDLPDRLQRAVRIASTHRALHHCRVGQIGAPSDWLVASHHDAETVRASWGPELVPIPVSALSPRANETAIEPEPEDKAVLESAEACLEPDARDVDRAMRVTRTMRALVADERLDAVTVRCFDLVTEDRTTGCLALSLLADEGIPAGCEGDIPSMLALLWVRYLLGSTGWMANPSWIAPDRGELRLAHCTAPRSMGESYTLRSHFESGLGVAIEAALPPGAVTLVRIGGRELKELWVVEGEVEASPLEACCCRTQALVRVAPQQAQELLTAPLGNHLVMVYGHHESILRRYHDLVIKDLRSTSFA